VFLVEHPHVYTHGRGANAHIPETSVVFGESVSHLAIERGGDVTYHGPGQVVAYPIVDIRALTGDLHRFLRWLEEVLIATIGEWAIEGHHHPDYTGAWVGDRKIASIGVAVRKWVSYHGVALNVNTDLRFFSAIHPCGLEPEVMTSMAELTGTRVPCDDVKLALARSLESTVPTKSLLRT
jgi:lipoate-protein ligase B